MNIYAKLTILCVFLVIFTSSILYYFANRSIQKTFREELLSDISSQSEQAMSTLEQFTYSRLTEIRLIVQNPNLLRAGSNQEQLSKELQKLNSLNPFYDGFALYNIDGVKITDSKSSGLSSPNFSVKGFKGQTQIITSVSQSDSANSFLQIASVIEEDRQKKGFLVGQVPLDQLRETLGDISMNSEENKKLNVTLVDQEGVILFSNNGSKSGTFKYFNLIKEAKPNEKEVKHIETDDYFYFVAKQKGYLDYPGENWLLVASVSKKSALSPIEEIQSSLIWTTIIVVVICFVLALIAANMFVSPLVRLSKAAKDISEGILTTEIKITSNDEVGKLAKQLTNASQVLIKRLDEQKILNEQLEDQKDEIADKKHLLEQVNSQISDSIIYAQRIQKSILPELSVMSRLVKDAFVVYEPKDVVSGDFYWFERVRQGRNEYLILACADCTGHGVPGAIMSIMGSNQLTNIIYYQNYLDPNKILTRLDKVIKFELRDSDSQNRDGMEIGLCVINLDDLTMEFSGAGISLLLKHKGSEELTVYKSPKYMIGGIEGDEKEVSSKLHTENIKLEEGDMLYLASDGFQDQFGGPSDKKFMSKNFKKLLETNSSLPMNEQGEKLHEAFISWKGDTPQTDDVLVIGVEI